MIQKNVWEKFIPSMNLPKCRVSIAYDTKDERGIRYAYGRFQFRNGTCNMFWKDGNEQPKSVKAEDIRYWMPVPSLDTQEEPVSEDLWEASKQYALRQVLASTDTEMSEQAYLNLRLFSGFELAVAHKDGAKWKKEYMMKNAIEAYIRRNKYTKKNVLNGFDVTCDAIQKFNGGDKVKVIVIKEE